MIFINFVIFISVILFIVNIFEDRYFKSLEELKISGELKTYIEYIYKKNRNASIIFLCSFQSFFRSFSLNN